MTCKSNLLNTDQINAKEIKYQQNCDEYQTELNEEDIPRAVFNQTYTSWATSEEQLEIDAFRQQKTIENNKCNLTQNLQENLEVDDLQSVNKLNKTMDIIGKDINFNLV